MRERHDGVEPHSCAERLAELAKHRQLSARRRDRVEAVDIDDQVGLRDVSSTGSLWPTKARKRGSIKYGRSSMCALGWTQPGRGRRFVQVHAPWVGHSQGGGGGSFKCAVQPVLHLHATNKGNKRVRVRCHTVSLSHDRVFAVNARLAGVDENKCSPSIDEHECLSSVHQNKCLPTVYPKACTPGVTQNTRLHSPLAHTLCVTSALRRLSRLTNLRCTTPIFQRGNAPTPRLSPPHPHTTLPHLVLDKRAPQALQVDRVALHRARRGNQPGRVDALHTDAVHRSAAARAARDGDAAAGGGAVLASPPRRAARGTPPCSSASIICVLPAPAYMWATWCGCVNTTTLQQRVNHLRPAGVCARARVCVCVGGRGGGVQTGGRHSVGMWRGVVNMCTW
eukprot:366296-Chlamydomonas_euryale.AAC.18